MNRPVAESSVFLIIAGPAGSGKSTLCERLVAENSSVERVVTCTTRQPRDGEVNGKDYHFFSNEEFDQKVEADAFVEWAKVHANRYGTLKSVIQEKLDEDIDLVMNVDVQGVLNFKKAAEADEQIGRRIVTVFINVPDFDELCTRLRGRGQDDEAEIARRMDTAKWELDQWASFDYVISSQSKDADFVAITNIWQAEKRRSSRL